MKNLQKTITGTVVSVRNRKTVIIEVIRLKRHPLYKKQLRKTKRFSAHNELDGIAVGDTVRICPTRPISRTKHFMVREKV